VVRENDEENCGMTQRPFILRAIVAVERTLRVRCQQPHCGHSVYARIHVVEEAEELLVLGSDCFAKRYGVSSTANFGGFGGGGGRALTDAERELLSSNTALLLAQFEQERAEQDGRDAAKLEALRQHAELHRHFAPTSQPVNSAPWQSHRMELEPTARASAPLPPWAELKKPNSSFFAYGTEDGQCWVLMQSGIHDGCFVVPAPIPFESWDEALPPSIGSVDWERNLYVSQRNINDLTTWFSIRCRKGSRIDSDAAAIQQFAQTVAETGRML
jgi:hypothetical protein